MAQVVAWAAAAWLFDAASLGVFVVAFGHRVSPDGLLIAFALANVRAAIPITPRGLGVAEAVLVPPLVGFGAPRPIAVLVVISYRFFNFWAPIPVGDMAYLSLRVKNALSRRRSERYACSVSSRSRARRHRASGPRVTAYGSIACGPIASSVV